MNAGSTRAGSRAATTREARLETTGVNVRFAGVHALDDVSLHLEQGEIVGLIGPNGAGKTTMVNVLSGFQRPTSGTVHLDGHDVTKWPAHRRSRSGLTRSFQAVRAFRGLSVRENVEAAVFASGEPRGSAAALTTQMLDLLGLADRADHLASSLSYGQERRLGIARAMAGRPRLLLLDEPAAGLNEQESDELMGILAQLRTEYGCGLLVIEHDMRLIMRLCERLYVLDYGRLLTEGTPDVVARDPRVLEAYLGSRGGADSAAS